LDGTPKSGGPKFFTKGCPFFPVSAKFKCDDNVSFFFHDKFMVHFSIKGTVDTIILSLFVLYKYGRKGT